MSDGGEMFGQMMLESLLAQRSITGAQGGRRGSLWVGILLIVSALAPLAIGAMAVKAQPDHKAVAVTPSPVNAPLAQVFAAKAPAGTIRFAAPATAQHKHITSTK